MEVVCLVESVFFWLVVWLSLDMFWVFLLMYNLVFGDCCVVLVFFVLFWIFEGLVEIDEFVLVLFRGMFFSFWLKNELLLLNFVVSFVLLVKLCWIFVKLRIGSLVFVVLIFFGFFIVWSVLNILFIFEIVFE